MLVKSKRFYPYFGKVNVTEAKVGIKSFRFTSICIVPAKMLALAIR